MMSNHPACRGHTLSKSVWLQCFHVYPRFPIVLSYWYRYLQWCRGFPKIRIPFSTTAFVSKQQNDRLEGKFSCPRISPGFEWVFIILCSDYRSSSENSGSGAELAVNCSTKEILHNSALVFEGTLETSAGRLLCASLWA
ncbi:hypothetical protein NPIL_218801 [Nephila pilipes]|uniref:Uncharacterized protein n=1 Tax=Nephila pilipes TaxID=299642 RepID=A0A8X6TRS3_NEPPI|nr:hypothetical protein NPIL_218801 [Nephila pilipes]